MKKGKRLKIPSSEYYHHVAAQEAVKRYHEIALERVKEQARKDIKELFEKKMKSHKDVYSCLKDVGDEVRNVYNEYLDIPPSKRKRNPYDPHPISNDLVDGQIEIHLEMQPSHRGEDLPQISPAQTDPSENPGEVPW